MSPGAHNGSPAAGVECRADRHSELLLTASSLNDTRSTQEQKASTSAAQTASRRLRGLRAHVTVIVGVPAHQLGVNSRGHLVRIVQVVVASAFGAVGVIPRGSSRQRVEHRSRNPWSGGEEKSAVFRAVGDETRLGEGALSVRSMTTGLGGSS